MDPCTGTQPHNEKESWTVQDEILFRRVRYFRKLCFQVLRNFFFNGVVNNQKNPFVWNNTLLRSLRGATAATSDVSVIWSTLLSYYFYIMNNTRNVYLTLNDGISALTPALTCFWEGIISSRAELLTTLVERYLPPLIIIYGVEWNDVCYKIYDTHRKTWRVCSIIIHRFKQILYYDHKR